MRLSGVVSRSPAFMVGAESVDAFRIEFAASVILQLSRSNQVATCTFSSLFEGMTREGRASAVFKQKAFVEMVGSMCSRRVPCG